MVKGVIFDMDGTMFDTERLSTKGWIYAGKKLGVDIPVALTDSFVTSSKYSCFIARAVS